MGRTLELGKGRKDIVGVLARPQSVEDRITILESQLKAMTHAFYSVRRVLEKEKGDRGEDAYNPGIPPDAAINKDGIPINTTLMGITEFAPYILTVGNDGLYYVNNVPYPSLSAAAAAVGAPLRKSGWRFWKTLDGSSVKEVYRL
jgi:hypothetical protein